MSRNECPTVSGHHGTIQTPTLLHSQAALVYKACRVQKETKRIIAIECIGPSNCSTLHEMLASKVTRFSSAQGPVPQIPQIPLLRFGARTCKLVDSISHPRNEVLVSLFDSHSNPSALLPSSPPPSRPIELHPIHSNAPPRPSACCEALANCFCAQVDNSNAWGQTYTDLPGPTRTYTAWPSRNAPVTKRGVRPPAPARPPSAPQHAAPDVAHGVGSRSPVKPVACAYRTRKGGHLWKQNAVRSCDLKCSMGFSFPEACELGEGCGKEPRLAAV